MQSSTVFLVGAWQSIGLGKPKNFRLIVRNERDWKRLQASTKGSGFIIGPAVAQMQVL
jgi:hypothetical protein